MKLHNNRTFVVKEITCPYCEGAGEIVDQEELYTYECPWCNGLGFQVDEIDSLTGYRLVTLEGEY